ncbi:MAG: DUF2203 family protein [Acidobacteria bacterium]|nr:MAG: DUF2203 family protein [Acidobacteriota bacterium]
MKKRAAGRIWPSTGCWKLCSDAVGVKSAEKKRVDKKGAAADSNGERANMTDMSEKYFSRHEAEQLLPMIEGFLKVAQEHKQAVDSAQVELTKAASRIMVLGGSYPAYSDLVKRKAERDQASERIVETISRIQETGCLVKDIDQGLIDFPSIIEGQEALLCWKQGESRIEYWHGLEDGFAGRKRLEGGSSGEPQAGPSRLQ